MDREEIERVSPAAWTWGERAPFRAIVTQTADPRWRELDFSLFPDLEVIYDGRNSLRGGRVARPRLVLRRRCAGATGRAATAPPGGRDGGRRTLTHDGRR
jgi:hypothetical protein